MLIVMVLIGGYIFDMFGRKFTTFYFILLGGFTLVFFPIVAPDQQMYKFLVAVFSLMIAPNNKFTVAPRLCASPINGQS